MQFLQVILLISLFAIEIQAVCEQTSFTEAQVRICVSKCVIQTVRGCVDSDAFLGDVTEVSLLTKVPYFRRAIFNNMPHLKHIDAPGVQRLYAGAFLNTPVIKAIDFTFGYMDEIPYGVFNDKSLEKVGLSWNSVSHIEEKAFSNMPNLKYMLLTNNKLDHFDKNWFKNSPNIEVLSLSNNRISHIRHRDFEQMRNLTRLDLSFNQIKEIESEAFNCVRRLDFLDLTRNNLTAIKVDVFHKGLTIKHLRLALNKLSFLFEEILEQGHVQKIGLYPNPWQCPCIDQVTGWLDSHSAKIENALDDTRIKWNPDLPICAIKVNNSEVCVLAYDSEFISTQEEYFNAVSYQEVIREKPTEPPNNFNNTFVALSPI